MAKKGDVFRFADNDYLIQTVEEKVVRVTKIVNGKPQKGRPSKMDRELVEKLVGEALDTTPTAVTGPANPPVPPTPPVTELTDEQVKKKKKGLKDILAIASKNQTLVKNDLSDAEDEELDLDDDEEVEESDQELSTLFDEN